MNLLKTEKKEINLYPIADIALIITIIVFILLIANKAAPKHLSGAMFLCIESTLLIALVQAVLGKNKVFNESEQPITAKPDKSDLPVVINPSQSMVEVDGVKVNGKVFKISDGTHVVIDKDGNIRTKSLIGKFLNKIHGGNLTTPPDSGWKALFES